jgi:hypothetical protein
MKKYHSLFIVCFFTATTALAYEQQDVNGVVNQMASYLNLSPHQVYQITPVIQKYSLEFQSLQQSIDDGTINQSVVDEQRQGIEAEETQDLSQYLLPYQLSEWRSLQKKLSRQSVGGNDSGEGQSDANEYSNYPHNP